VGGGEGGGAECVQWPPHGNRYGTWGGEGGGGGKFPCLACHELGKGGGFHILCSCLVLNSLILHIRNYLFYAYLRMVIDRLVCESFDPCSSPGGGKTYNLNGLCHGIEFRS
jgi:hypothetical protein